jgi:hypothetical protein
VSEYQYYEFQAIDRPLSKEQMAELRAVSTRATITPGRFVNVYHYGDLRANPLVLVERYFDAHVYVANWGTHQFVVRLPRSLLNVALVTRYAVESVVDVHEKGNVVILEFTSRDDEGGRWIEDEESESWMPALLPIRADLAAGDLRALYLGWLAAAGATDIDDDSDSDGEIPDDFPGELPGEDVEPPVPPGLADLTASLQALADFLRIDRDLIAAAAERSDRLPKPPAPGDVTRWIAEIPSAEKDSWLTRFMTGEDTTLRAEIIHRFRQENTPTASMAGGARTVAELRAVAQKRAETRRRREAEQKEAERERRAREATIAREKHLNSLIGREESIWSRIEPLIEMKRAAEYDQAVQLLVDLRDISARTDRSNEFRERLRLLRDRHPKKLSFLQRLDRAGV